MRITRSITVILKARFPKANTAVARFSYGTVAIGSPKAARRLSKDSSGAISSFPSMESVFTGVGSSSG